MTLLRCVLTSFAALAAASLAVAHADPASVKPAAPAAAPKDYPAQSAVAAKTAFGTIPASDKSLTKALDAKALAPAQKLVGKSGSFTGTVTQVYTPRNHSIVALDFAPNYHDALTADIAPADYAKFPDLNSLQGKHVLVTGEFTLHGEAIQVAVSSPSQIKIVIQR